MPYRRATTRSLKLGTRIVGSLCRLGMDTLESDSCKRLSGTLSLGFKEALGTLSTIESRTARHDHGSGSVNRFCTTKSDQI